MRVRGKWWMLVVVWWVCAAPVRAGLVEDETARIIRLYQQGTATQQQDALIMLGMFAQPEGVKTLIAAAQSPDPLIRAGAVRALGQAGDAGAVPVLLTATRDEFDMVAIPAILALGQCQDAAAFDALRAMAQDANDRHRATAVEALGRSRDARVIPILLDALQGTQPDDVRNAAAQVATEFFDVQALGLLIKASVMPQGSASPSLGEAITRLSRLPEAEPLLIACLRDPDRAVRMRAMEGLRTHPAPEITEALVNKITDPDEMVQSHAFRILTQRTDEKSVQTVISYAANRKSAFHAQAIAALGKVKDPAVPGILQQALKEREPEVASAAVSALSVNGTPEALEMLFQRLQQHPPEALRLQLLFALGQHQDPRALDALLHMAARIDTVQSINPLGNHIHGLLQCLAGYHDPRVFDFFQKILASPNAEWRAIACQQAISSTDPQFLALFIPALTDQKFFMRLSLYGRLCQHHVPIPEDISLQFLQSLPTGEQQAGRSMVMKGGIAGVKAVFTYLRQHPDNKSMRAGLSFWLNELDESAQDTLLAVATSDQDVEFRSFVIAQLSAFPNARTQECLIGLLSDPQAAVRQAALNVLATREWIEDLGKYWTRLPVPSRYYLFADRRALPAMLAALQDEQAGVRAAAAGALAMFRDPRTFEPLCALLRDPDSAVRAAACTALIALPHWQGVPPALEVMPGLEKDGRNAVASALGQTGDLRAVAPLCQLLLHDPDAGVRETAAGALASVGEAEAVPALCAALNDPVEWARSSAAMSLGSLRDRRAIEPLAAEIAGQKDDRFRSRCCAALALFQDPRSLTYTPFFMYQDADWFVKNSGGDALTRCRIPSAVKPLMQLIATDFSDANRSGTSHPAAFAALAEIGDARAIPLMLQSLHHWRAQLSRGEIALALARLHATQAVPTLHMFFQDPLPQPPSFYHAQIHMQINLALCQLGDAAAWDRFCAAITGEEAEVSRAALSVFLEPIPQEPAAVTEAMAVALGARAMNTRLYAAMALVNRQDARALPVLLEAYRQADVEISAFALNALLRINDPASRQALAQSPLIPSLLAQAREDDADTRAAALRLLAVARDAHAVELLTATLQDDRSSLRAQAVIALGDTADPHAVPLLCAALDDPSSVVREHAAIALGQLGDRTAIPALEARAPHEDATRVTTAITTALHRLQ